MPVVTICDPELTVGMPAFSTAETGMDARANMMSAAAMGAAAFQQGLGATHSPSHLVGAVYNIHYGVTNAVIMPIVLDFNHPAIEERGARKRFSWY